jgi:hypothetical protein
MPPRDVVEARPRSTTEILDDAWRLYFADPPLLLALSALFVLPALAGLVALLYLPADATLWTSWLLPFVVSLLLPLTGLSIGACQEVYHSWAESYPIQFGDCLKAAGQRGLHHMASQALALLPPLVILACLVVIPGNARFQTAGVSLVIWVPIAMFGLSRQVSLAAGQKRFWRALKHSMRATGQHPGRAFLLLILRAVVLAFAVLNLHLFLSFGLWAAENLGGFDVAFLGVLCALGNPAYLLTVVLLAVWLLLPWNEAINYMFFVDARTRYEGLDLWQRVEELFPVRKQSKVGGVVLALTVGLLGAGSATAEEPLSAVRAARQELAVIRKEVQTANPYPGSQRWAARVQALGDRLDKSEKKPGRYRWFHQATAGFAGMAQARALEVLDDVDARLALIEDSWTRPLPADEPPADHIKGLVPPDKNSANDQRQRVEDADDKPKEPPPADDGGGGPGGGFGTPMGPAVVGPTALGSLAYPLMIVLVGLALAALLVGIAIAVVSWWRGRQKAAPRQQGQLANKPADYLENPDKQDPAELWRRSDELARRGDFLAAVRTLYLAVLALLHQGGFIRYERTRTNGEYVDQLRPRKELHQPFVRLTGLFEVKWYGEWACEPEDYRACRELAGEIRRGETGA